MFAARTVERDDLLILGGAWSRIMGSHLGRPFIDSGCGPRIGNKKPHVALRASSHEQWSLRIHEFVFALTNIQQTSGQCIEQRSVDRETDNYELVRDQNATSSTSKERPPPYRIVLPRLMALVQIASRLPVREGECRPRWLDVLRQSHSAGAAEDAEIA
jgi:hypothetical protein